MFFVYILENAAGKFYVGQTHDLDARIADHNRTDAFDGHYTRKNGPWRLVWSEEHESRSSAVSRERQIKLMKSARWIRERLLGHSAVDPEGPGSKVRSRGVGAAEPFLKKDADRASFLFGTAVAKRPRPEPLIS
jgi:putative endonuclease